MKLGALVPALVLGAAIAAPPSLTAAPDQHHRRDRDRRSAGDRAYRGEGPRGSQRSYRHGHRRGDQRRYHRDYRRYSRRGARHGYVYRPPRRHYRPYPRPYYRPYGYAPAPPVYHAPYPAPRFYRGPVYGPPPYRGGLHGRVAIGRPFIGFSLHF